jgi:hypothetical protein
MRPSSLTTLFVFLIISSLLVSCSISYSTGKSSDSSSFSFDSSSASSGSGDDDDEDEAASTANTYAEDVTVATKLYVTTQDGSQHFMSTISNLARAHGIEDWEQEKITYSAMGKGLKQSGITEEKIETLPYFHTILESEHYDTVLAGYH